MHLEQISDFFRHFDVWLQNTVAQYGTLTYAILFAIIFAETGLVVTPFLPGDSLLFALGAFSARDGSALSVAVLYPLLIAAALIGDNVNYWAGRLLGRRLFQSETSKILNKAHLIRTEAFFARYGGKAIFLARFVPIVRTFAPFVAGMGNMTYARFLTYSVAGAFLWVGVAVTAGYLFGNLPFVKNNFEKVILGIIVVSLLPALIEYLNHRRAAKGGR
jgi:membrane-associated protein